MGLDQLAMALCGAAAAGMSQARSSAWRRWACVLGMAGQPFWFYAAWTQGQWELLAIALIYMAAWLRGLWVYWLAPQRAAVDSGLGTIQITPGR